MRAAAAAALLAMTAAAPAALAGAPYPPVPIHVADLRGDDPAVAAFLADLRDIAARRDREALAARLGQAFFWARDHGGRFVEGDPPVANFERAADLSNDVVDQQYRDRAWEKLARKFAARSIGAAGQDEPAPGEPTGGSLCAPAEPQFGTAQSAPDASVEARIEAWTEKQGLTFWYDFGYVEAENLRVRARPDASASAVDVLSREGVRVLDWEEVADADPASPRRWLAVTTPKGTDGYVAAEFVESFLTDRFCFARQDDGRWAISGYVGGGD